MSGERPGCSIDSQGEALAEIQQRMDLLWAQNPIREILRPLCLRSWQIKLTFQRQWYQDFPWLHFIPGVEGALCFYSRKWTSFSLTGQTELPIHEPTAKSHEQQKRLAGMLCD